MEGIFYWTYATLLRSSGTFFIGFYILVKMAEAVSNLGIFDDDEIVRVTSPQIQSLAIFDENEPSSVVTETEEEEELNREDIKEAQALPEETRQSLNYGSKEKFSSLCEKVRARPALDAEISEKLQMMESLLENPAYEQFHPVLKHALVNIKDAMVKAELGGASLKLAIEVIDKVLVRTKQTCDLSTENFQLSEDTVKHLMGYETLEIQRVESLRKLNMDDAEQLQIECIKLLDDAVKSSNENVDKVIQKKRDVDERHFLVILQETWNDVEQTIQDEIQYLNMTNDDCQRDIETTQRSQKVHKERRETALEKFETKDKELDEDIQNNEEEQAKLRALLEELERKRLELKDDKEKRTRIQRYADQEQTRVREELEKMEQDFQSLAKQTQASLEVMLLMSDTSQEVLKNCIDFENKYERRLHELDIMALSQQRKALANRAVTCKLQMKDSEESIAYFKGQVKTLDDELKALAMRSMKEEVKKKQVDRKNFKTQLNQCKSSKAMNESKLIGIELELKEIDARLKGLGETLMSIDDMVTDRQTQIQEAFNTEDPYGSLTSDVEY